MVAGAYAIGGSGQGDIILSSGGKKKSKKIVIIIAVILAVVLLGTGAAVFLINNMSKSGNSYFDDLKKYIEVGNGKNEKGDLIYAVSISNESNDAIRDYYRELTKKEEAFFNSINIDNDVISEYKTGLRVLKNAIDYVEIENKLIASYSVGGENAAKKIIEDNIECGGTNYQLSEVCSSEVEYYNAVLRTYNFYNKVGCYIDNNYVVECAKEKYSLEEFSNEIIDFKTPSECLLQMSSDTVRKLLSTYIVQLNEAVMRVLKNA